MTELNQILSLSNIFSAKLLAAFIVFYGSFSSSKAVYSNELVFTELETLKPLQKVALEDFKKIVEPIVPNEYMKEDIYLVKFMQFNRFNVQKAVDHLKETLKWREENNIDQFYSSPPDYITEFQKDYPIYNDGSDKAGRPICEVPFGSWPIRKAAIAGKLKNLILYMHLNCAEKATTRLREQHALGKNLTDWIFLSDMDGFSIIDQGCPACLPLSLSITSGTERYYPHSVYGIWTINTPDSFATIARLVRPVMSAPTRAAFKVFTQNKAEWQPFLKKRVDFNEISDWFGGGKERKLF